MPETAQRIRRSGKPHDLAQYIQICIQAILNPDEQEHDLTSMISSSRLGSSGSGRDASVQDYHYWSASRRRSMPASEPVP